MKTVHIIYSPCDLFVSVDDGDVHFLEDFTWYGLLSRNTFYAVRKIRENGTRKTIILHREILRAPKGVKVDHIDGNGLNCVHSNMRLATNPQNGQNSRYPDNKSGYRGVYLHYRGGYQAQIKVNGERKYIGTYRTAIDAAVAYDRAATKYHGEFAVLNFPKRP